MGQLENILGKRPLKVAALEQIYKTFGARPTFVSDLISAIRQLEPEFAYRPIWLLIRLARDVEIDVEALRRIAGLSGEMSHWAARLCLCQFFARVGYPSDTREELFLFFSDCFTDRRPIVRAWAISCLLLMSDDVEYRSDVEAMLKRAKMDPAKSMQARLRQLAMARASRRIRQPVPPQARARILRGS